jgi:hypothetical protein
LSRRWPPSPPSSTGKGATDMRKVILWKRAEPHTSTNQRKDNTMTFPLAGSSSEYAVSPEQKAALGVAIKYLRPFVPSSPGIGGVIGRLEDVLRPRARSRRPRPRAGGRMRRCGGSLEGYSGWRASVCAVARAAS